MNLEALARLLGLSKTTVSRALAGYPDVSAKTRDRVLDAARHHGYQPNPFAQGLRSGRTSQVGVVVPANAGGASSPFFLDLLLSASQSLADRGFDLLLTSAPMGEAETLALRRLVEVRRADAVIVGQTRRHDARVGYLLDRGVPFVCHGRTEESRPYAFVDLDGERAFRTACERLLELGHRRIAYVGASAEIYTYAAHRRAGYEAGLRSAGIAPDPTLIVEGEGGEALGRAAVAELLQRAEAPSAFLCATDLEAVGALHAIAAAGLVAGRDVSVIGHDDLPLSRHTDPPLTTWSQAYAAIGVRLVEILVELLAGSRPADHGEIWTTELVNRASVGPGPHARV